MKGGFKFMGDRDYYDTDIMIIEEDESGDEE